MNCEPNDLAEVVRLDAPTGLTGGLPPEALGLVVIVRQLLPADLHGLPVWLLDQPAIIHIAKGGTNLAGRRINPGSVQIDGLPDFCLRPIRPGRRGLTLTGNVIITAPRVLIPA